MLRLAWRVQLEMTHASLFGKERKRRCLSSAQMLRVVFEEASQMFSSLCTTRVLARWHCMHARVMRRSRRHIKVRHIKLFGRNCANPEEAFFLQQLFASSGIN